MSTGRDPRVDPRPGDEVEVNCDDYATTVRVEHVGYYVHFRPSGARLISDLTPKGWRVFARNARVVARGQETEGGS